MAHVTDRPTGGVVLYDENDQEAIAVDKTTKTVSVYGSPIVAGGTPGPTGPTGATGSAGADGAPGAQGRPGSDGSDGDDGAQGPPGTAGAAGTTGAQGSVGSNGPPGQDGDDAYDWPMPGPQGIAGTAGATGAAGIGLLGPPGVDGEDAFDWPLPGPPGAAGSSGAPGAAGTAGAIGPPGADGEDAFDWPLPGAQGAPGTPGSTGAAGATGPAGTPGQDGEDAFDWPLPGPQGAPGTPGTTGGTGPAGAQGYIGPPGQDGEDGLDIWIPPGVLPIQQMPEVLLASVPLIANTGNQTSTTEAIISPQLTIPAGFVRIGTTIEFEFHISCAQGAVAQTTPGIVYQMRWGGLAGTVVATTGIITPATLLAASGGFVRGLLVVRTLGASGTVMANVQVQDPRADRPTVTLLASTSRSSTPAAAIAVNTTTSNVLCITSKTTIADAASITFGVTGFVGVRIY